MTGLPPGHHLAHSAGWSAQRLHVSQAPAHRTPEEVTPPEMSEPETEQAEPEPETANRIAAKVRAILARLHPNHNPEEQ